MGIVTENRDFDKKRETAPQALRERPQWVLWRATPRPNGKAAKQPHSPHSGNRASVTEPATWGSYQQAQAACERGGYDGIGFVLTESDPFTGIDLDDCFGESGELSQEARAIVEATDSYTELSPSGTGLHVILEGELPPGGNRRGKVEAYDSGRYFTFTGQRLAGTPTEPQPRQEALEAFHAAYIASPTPTPTITPHAAHSGPQSVTDGEALDRALNARNGGKFAALFGGDTSGHANDHSRADLALCNLLAYATDCDAGAIDRLFRQSGLYRPKWDTPHSAGGATYGQMTVEKAVRDTLPSLARRNPDAASALPSDSDLTAQLAEAHARIKHLEAEREAIQRILRHETFNGNQSRLLANLLLDATPKDDTGEWLAVGDASNPKLAGRYGMSESTVQRTMQRLKLSGTVETEEAKTHEDERGRLLPHPITESVTVVLRGIDALELPGQLPDTQRAEKNRKRSADLARLARAAKAVQEIPCPECGQVGCLHLYCTTNGEIIRPEEWELTPPAKLTPPLLQRETAPPHVKLTPQWISNAKLTPPPH